MNPSDFDPGPLCEASTQFQDGRVTLVLARDFDHPPEDVWRALTDPARVRAWAPYEPDRDLGETGPAALQMIDGMSSERLPARVHRVEAPRLLDYDWADGRLLWELSARDSGTRLTLRHTVDDPDWLPMMAAGWHLGLVGVDLLLSGRPVPDMTGESAMEFGWRELRDAYQEKLRS